MQLQGLPGQPAIYDFLVNGVLFQTLCDDPTPDIGTVPYEATENTLSDLSGTVLNRSGDLNELSDYETIAILDLQALSNPSLIPEVEEAEWSITTGRTDRDSGSAGLLSWAQAQDPADYDLSGFVIFASTEYQEQTGFLPTPELASGLITASGLCLLLLLRKRK
jgi:hypothetical protein